MFQHNDHHHRLVHCRWIVDYDTSLRLNFLSYKSPTQLVARNQAWQPVVIQQLQLVPVANPLLSQSLMLLLSLCYVTDHILSLSM